VEIKVFKMKKSDILKALLLKLLNFISDVERIILKDLYTVILKKQFQAPNTLYGLDSRISGNNLIIKTEDGILLECYPKLDFKAKFNSTILEVDDNQIKRLLWIYKCRDWIYPCEILFKESGLYKELISWDKDLKFDNFRIYKNVIFNVL
jgi:hypothetical protein